MALDQLYDEFQQSEYFQGDDDVKIYIFAMGGLINGYHVSPANEGLFTIRCYGPFPAHELKFVEADEYINNGPTESPFLPMRSVRYEIDGELRYEFPRDMVDGYVVSHASYVVDFTPQWTPAPTHEHDGVPCNAQHIK